MQKLGAPPDKLQKELERLLKLLAVQRRLFDSDAKKSTAVLQQGETAEAQAVLAAQRRLKHRSHQRG
jgi:hypothetical protein